MGIYPMTGEGRMANYLVTGGAGFIGSHFVKKCADKGNRVIVIDSLDYSGNPENLSGYIDRIYIEEVIKEYYPLGETYGIIQKIPRDPERSFGFPVEKVDFVENLLEKFYSSSNRILLIMGNVIDRAILSSLLKGIDYVVHFAAETHVDRSHLFPESFIVSDIIGTFVLLEAVKHRNIKKFIHISTDEVYGETPEGISFDESSPLMPTNPYAASKAAADRIAHSYYHSYNVPVCIMRLSNNYGPYQFPEKFIPLMIIRAIQDSELPLYGDGNQKRDWIYVGDAVKAVELVIEKGNPGEIYNVSGGNEIKNIDVVKRILKVLGKPESLIRYVKDRPAHDKRYSMDDNKIRELGFEPEMEFEGGLERTIEWYRENQGWWKRIFDGNKKFREFFDKWYKEERGI